MVCLDFERREFNDVVFVILPWQHQFSNIFSQQNYIKKKREKREGEGFGRKKRTTKVRILNEWTDCYQAPIVTGEQYKERERGDSVPQKPLSSSVHHSVG